MIKLRYKLTKTYLTKATQKFTLDDIAAARKLFDNASSSGPTRKILSVEDISATAASVELRIYRDNVSNDNLPVVVYFHGGGFALGSIKSHDSICRSICKYSNCVVVSVGYSLAPEAPYPTPINEGLNVLQWLQRNAKKQGIDNSLIYLAGDSAGGSIAVKIASDPRLQTPLKGLILIYPTLDPKLTTESMQQYATGHFLTKSLLRQFWELYQSGATVYRPLTRPELTLLPPVLVIAAEKDVLRSEGIDFVEDLQSLGKEVDYECYSDMLHGFVQFPRFVSKKTKVFKRIAAFIGQHSS